MDEEVQGQGLGMQGMRASGIATAAGGVADIISGFVNKKQAKSDVARANADLNKVLGNQPSLATPGEYYEAVKNAYDQRLMQMRMDDINKSLATTTQAAQQYGSRGLGSIMAAQGQAQDLMQREALTQQQLQTDALTNLANARQNEVMRREDRSNRDIEYAYDAKALADASLQQSRQQIAQGAVGLVGGVAKTAIGFMEYGGRVEKTPGEYSHEENEMYVVDEEGRDVGIALTGGEYVIDPGRAERLKEKSRDSSLKGMKVLRREVQKMIRDFEQEDKE